MSLRDAAELARTIQVYRDDGRVQPYTLRSTRFELLEDVGVGVAAFDCVSNLHALTPNLMQETFLILEHAKRLDGCRALVWTATGTKAFCAGAALRGDMDLHVPTDVAEEYRARGLAPQPDDMALGALTRAMWDFPKPSVAAINGLAVGGGANIALANYFDLVVCAEHARFKYPFADLGITPELGSSKLVPFVVGMARAKRIFLLGDWMSAREAEAMGLASHVVESARLLPAAVELATRLAAKPPHAVRGAKRLLNHHLREQLDGVLAEENRTIKEALRALSEGGGTFGSKL